VLPWLIVATGTRLSSTDMTIVATEFALNNVSELQLQLSPLNRLVPPPAALKHAAGAPLSDSIQCLCALHKAAESIRVCEQMATAAARRAVLLSCDAGSTSAAVAKEAMATLLTAYLHLVAFLSLQESAAKVEAALHCQPDLVCCQANF
jgi:hypothetical protein